MFKVVSLPYSEIPSERRARLEAIAQVEFGGFAVVRQTVWAAPDWSFLAMDGTELACFYNLVQRVARFDGELTPVAGVNNLITLPAYRGRGLASSLLRDTESFWFQSLGAKYGLLLCADALRPFYSRLGWRRIEAAVRFAQPTGQHTWSANCMLLAPDRGDITAREIDLCGLPW